MFDLFVEINLTGLASVFLFYLLILGVGNALGMWAAGKKSNVEGVSEEVGSRGALTLAKFTISPFVEGIDLLLKFLIFPTLYIYQLNFLNYICFFVAS